MNWLERMRADWDERAKQDAERAIYTRDTEGDVEDFDQSGLANYNQLVRPYLPVLLDGRPPPKCRAVEIGCGVGRMTRWFARDFGEVHAFDVSPRMIAMARARLNGTPNVFLHTGSGTSLLPLDDASADLVFSYIVFQHIPDRAIIEAYVAEAARVLRPGGVFKFQVNGAVSASRADHVADTWFGVSLARKDVEAMLAAADLSPLMMEGEHTQYSVITAARDHPGLGSPPHPFVFPGEPWAESQLLSGFGEPVDHSWRPMAGTARALVRVPAGSPLRFFCGFYVWPGESASPRRLIIRGAEQLITEYRLDRPGDHYVDCEVISLVPGDSTAELQFEFRPSFVRPPAMRCFGFFVPRESAL